MKFTHRERVLVFICRCDQCSFSKITCRIFLASGFFSVWFSTSDNRWQQDSGFNAVVCNLSLLHFCAHLKARDSFVNGGVLGVKVRVARYGAAVENWVLEPCMRSGDMR